MQLGKAFEVYLCSQGHYPYDERGSAFALHELMPTVTALADPMGRFPENCHPFEWQANTDKVTELRIGYLNPRPQDFVYLQEGVIIAETGPVWEVRDTYVFTSDLVIYEARLLDRKKASQDTKGSLLGRSVEELHDSFAFRKLRDLKAGSVEVSARWKEITEDKAGDGKGKR